MWTASSSMTQPGVTPSVSPRVLELCKSKLQALAVGHSSDLFPDWWRAGRERPHGAGEGGREEESGVGTREWATGWDKPASHRSCDPQQADAVLSVYNEAKCDGVCEGLRSGPAADTEAPRRVAVVIIRG